MRTLTISLLIGGLMACDPDKDTETTTPEDTGGEETTEPLIDADADGYTEDEDCDDASSSINPGAPEVCDGIDNNCDGQIDEGVTLLFYPDSDGDGYGEDADVVEDCEGPDGYITDGGDCDDGDFDINPGAKEVCDYADNNCDGEIDEKLTILGYADNDGDGFGVDGTTYDLCEIVDGYSKVAGDCDDSSADVFPGNTEVCDGIDNDCDKTTEDGGIEFNDGVKTIDMSADFLSGTAKAPTEMLFSTPGDLSLCAGTFYVDIDIEADVNITGAGSGQTILSGGGVSAVLNWTSSAVTSAIQGVTIQDGVGHYDSSLGQTVGGVSRCMTESSVTLTDVEITGGSADLGGGVFVYNNCAMDFIESEIHTNEASYGAGMFIYDGDVTFVDSQIWDNTAAYSGGGVAMEGYYGPATLDLTDSLVTANEGYYGAGVSVIYDSTLTCTGSGKGKYDAGITDNYNSSGLYGGGLLTYFTSSFSSAYVSISSCDFGTAKNGDDNDPNDVYDYDNTSEYSSYGDKASFTCDYTNGCY